MPVPKRRRWVAIWNSVYADTHDEGRAFRIANGTVKALEDVVHDDRLWDDMRMEVEQELFQAALSIILLGAWLAQNDSDAMKALGDEGYVLPPMEELFGVNPEEAFVGAARSYTNRWWQQLTSTRRDALRAAILQARAEGRGSRWVAEQIEELFGPQRARMIAVTEMTNLLGHGAQVAFQAMGYRYWEWRTAMDQRVCPICAALDGQKFVMATSFEAAHVNCRCWNVPSGEPILLAVP